jgi:hypothetical protein
MSGFALEPQPRPSGPLADELWLREEVRCQSCGYVGIIARRLAADYPQCVACGADGVLELDAGSWLRMTAAPGHGIPGAH